MSAVQQMFMGYGAAQDAGISHVASTSNSVASNTTVTTNTPGGIQSGDLLVFCHINSNQLTTLNSGPSGASINFTDTSASNGIRIWSKVATGSEPGTFSVVLNATNNQALSIHAYRGVSALDTAGTLARASSVAPSISPVAEGVLIALFSGESAVAVTSGPGGMDQRSFVSANSLSQAVYDLIPSPAGATGTKTIVWTTDPTNRSSLLIQYS